MNRALFICLWLGSVAMSWMWEDVGLPTRMTTLTLPEATCVFRKNLSIRCAPRKFLYKFH